MCKRIGVITYEVHGKVYHDAHYLDGSNIKKELKHIQGLWEMNSCCFDDDWPYYNFISMSVFFAV